jgi:hypothetical protein
MFWHSSRHARSTARLSEITRYVPNPTGIDDGIAISHHLYISKKKIAHFLDSFVFKKSHNILSTKIKEDKLISLVNHRLIVNFYKYHVNVQTLGSYALS